MPKYLNKNATAKQGINFVRSIVEGQNSIFHKIELENDIGIDGIIELIEDERPTHVQIALQVKSGESYYSKSSSRCIIPVGDHADYWKKHPLPVLGFVFIPSLNRAYWTDIKSQLSRKKDGSAITFEATEANRFDESTFSEIFFPRFLRRVPCIPLDRAISLFNSQHKDETLLGLTVLFRKFCNDRRAWDAMLSFFKERAAEEIPKALVYYMAHIPWHGDIAAWGITPNCETRDYVRHHFETFSKIEVVKLLHQIDEENGIARGTTGQSVEAIISNLPQRDKLLSEVARDTDIQFKVREFASYILSMHTPNEAIPLLELLERDGSWFATDLIAAIREFGVIDVY